MVIRHVPNTATRHLHLKSSATGTANETKKEDQEEERSASANRKEDAASSICQLCYEDLEEAEAEADAARPAAEQGKDLEELGIDLEIGEKIATTITAEAAAAAGGKQADRVPCGHTYCLDCLDEYFKYSISTHRVPIPCPSIGSTTSCDQYVPSDIVRQVFVLASSSNSSSSSSPTHDYEYWIRKYTRLDRLAQDPSLVPCPRCDELVSTRKSAEGSNQLYPSSTSMPKSTPSSAHYLPSSLSAASPLSSPTESENNKTMVLVVCPNVDCQHEFCSLHGDLHLGRSCREYEAEQRELVVQQEEEQVHLNLQQVIAFKPCSHCGAALSKDDGCDHMVCPACHKDMCYRCGTHLYLSGRFLRSCSKCQGRFVDHRHEAEYQFRLRCTLLFYILPPTVLAFFFAMMMYRQVKDHFNNEQH